MSRSDGAGSDGGATRSVGEVVEDTVGRVCPAELPLAAQYRSNDHAFVVRNLRRRDRDDVLGFGLLDVATYVSPVLFIALDQALRKVVDVPVEGAVRSLGRRLRRSRRRDPGTVPTLDAAQIRQVCDAVELTMIQDDVPRARAHDVAEELERRLRQQSGLPDPIERDDEDDERPG